MPRGAGHKQQNKSGNISVGFILFPLHSCCAKGHRFRMPTEISAVAQILQKKKRNEMRKGCRYNREELAVLLLYKEHYRLKTTHDNRDNLLRSSILVDIFNHWLSMGVDLTEVEVQKREKVCELHVFFLSTIVQTLWVFCIFIYELCQWLANNWCPHKSTYKGPTSRKKSCVDMMWQQMPDVAEAKVVSLFEIEHGANAVSTAAEHFALRSKAGKVAYLELSPDQKVRIDRLVEESGRDSNPPEVQRK